MDDLAQLSGKTIVEAKEEGLRLALRFVDGTRAEIQMSGATAQDCWLEITVGPDATSEQGGEQSGS